MPLSDLVDTNGDAAGIGVGHDGLTATANLGDTCRLVVKPTARYEAHVMPETRHTVVAGFCRRLDQPAMNSW